MSERMAAVAHPEAATTKVSARQLPLLIALADDGVDDDAGILAELNRQVEPGQRLGKWTVGQCASSFEHDQMVGKARHFVGRVTDVEHWNVELVVQLFQIGQNFLATLEVERGERLVEQQ